MANFCTKCGKPIEQCTCYGRVNSGMDADNDLFGSGFQFDFQKLQQNPAPSQPRVNPAAQRSNPVQQSAHASPQRPAPAPAQPRPAQPRPAPAQPPRQGSFCTKCGKPLVECTCGKSRVPLPQPSSGSNKDRMTLKDFFGFYESDNNVDNDYMENNKRIVPDVLEKCEGEVPIRQFKIGKSRKRISLSWGYSRIQITNKRLIQRTVGRSIIGKDVDHVELSIDEICGISYSRGKQFSLGDFLIMFVLLTIMGMIGFGIGQIGEALGYIITILVILGVGYLRFFQKVSLNGPYALANALAVGTWLGTLDVFDVLDYLFDSDGRWFAALLCLIVVIAMFIFWIRYSILPSITITARTKSMNQGAMGVWNLKRLAKITAPSIILPTEETEQAVKELNAIITDVQKLGDYAIEKWSDQPVRRK